MWRRILNNVKCADQRHGRSIFHWLLILVIPASMVVPARGAKGSVNIREIDFLNFTYRSTTGCETVRAQNGKFSGEPGQSDIYFEVRQIAYGDLTRDRREEAAVLTLCNSGGSGTYSEVHIYTVRKGRAALLRTLKGGDRAFGGFQSIKLDRGLLMVERYAPEESGGGACCPEYVDLVTYRLAGRNLARVGKIYRRKAEG